MTSLRRASSLRARARASDLLSALMIAALASGCRAAPPASLTITSDVARSGFELAPGQTVTVASYPTITFLSVESDKRCPRGRECAESGPVTVRLRLGAAMETQLSVLDRDRGGPDFQGIRSCTPFDSEALRLRDVRPWPSGATPPSPGEYRIELVVMATCGAGKRK